MNKVEFFGISGSGKTSFKASIESKFKKKKIATYSYKDVIEKFLPFYERNIFNYFLLRVFFFFRKKVIKIFISKIISQVEVFIKNLFFKV